MSWRFVGLIFFFGIVLVFSGFNWKNSCDISLGFTVLEKVPVYLTVFSSFLLGLICSIPFTVAARLKAKAKTKAAPGAQLPAGDEKSSAKKPFFTKKDADKAPAPVPGPEEGGKYPDDGTYGID